MRFINAEQYSPAANIYIKKGYYTDILPGTKEYFDHWDKEAHRCLYGYLGMSGYHYFYLNYSPIYKTEIQEGERRADRIFDFPDMYDGDYYYYNYLERAKNEPQRFRIINSASSLESVKEQIITILKDFLC